MRDCNNTNNSNMNTTDNTITITSALDPKVTATLDRATGQVTLVAHPSDVDHLNATIGAGAYGVVRHDGDMARIELPLDDLRALNETMGDMESPDPSVLVDAALAIMDRALPNTKLAPCLALYFATDDLLDAVGR